MPKRPVRPRVSKESALRRVTKAERWLNLLAFLVDHRSPVAREEIFTEVEDYKGDWVTGNETIRESVRRKFERDKSGLREIGVIIEPGPKISSPHSEQDVDSYRLKPADLYLPCLELSGRRPAAGRPYASLPSLSLKPEEFLTLRRAAERVQALGDNALGASAASAIRKLSFDLPELEPGVKELAFSATVDESFHSVFRVLRAGVEGRRPVACTYYSIGRDVEARRVIEPYGLLLSWGIWYCVARAREKEALRVFRVSRMREAEVLSDQPQFTVPETFSVRNYLDRAPWELSEDPPVRARVRIAFPHSRWVLAEGLGEILEATDEEGGALLAFEVRAVDPFVRWLLPFGAQVEVLDPASIRDRLAVERDRIRALYR
ncbi:MAG: WYL domain-containing protein [Gemmatimonadota bacterium]|nr:WYL domain-containing protein [Gemmatimonadota bacterium]